MTNKLVTAYIDNAFDHFSSKEYIEEFFGGYYNLEGLARVKGRSSSGLEVEPEYGFEDTEAQVQVVTVQYTVTEEYAVSLLPEPEAEQEEEQDNGNSELEDGDIVRPSEPESDSGLDEGVEPIEPVEANVDEPSGGGEREGYDPKPV